MKSKIYNKLIRYILLSLIIILIFLLYKILFSYKFKESFNETIMIEDCIYGKFKCFKGDKIICESIQKNKSWEPELLEILKQNYKQNTNFLDIGSNYGCHTIGIANEIKKNNGNGKIYSFEIQPEIINLFKENIELNNLQDYIIINEFGLGDKNENKEFIISNNYDYDLNPGSASLNNKDKNDKNKKETITIKKLDDLNIDNISLIKIDVEGYELQALEGGIKTISKHKPTIIIEIWNNNFDEYKNWINKNFPFYDILKGVHDNYILKSNI